VSEISTPRLTPLKYFKQNKEINNQPNENDINELEQKIKNIE
jgi:hypothetical protein